MTVEEIVSEITGTTPGPDDVVSADSLDLIEISLDLEQWYGCPPLPDDVNTIRGMRAHVESNGGHLTDYSATAPA